MTDFSKQITRLQTLLDQNTSPEKKEWWERYLRHVITFRGIGIPDIRNILIDWRRAQGIDTWSLEDQLDLALALFAEPLAEDKLAGILYLQNYLYDQFDWKMLLEKYAAFFQNRNIFDWNTCDWFCVRVLGPTIRQHGSECAEAISQWHQAPNLWQARASVVAFVKLADKTEYYPLIQTACVTLIQREERFAKTAVGWILREISRHDPEWVRHFVRDYLVFFSLEALKNALKYFEKAERQHFVEKIKSNNS